MERGRLKQEVVLPEKSAVGIFEKEIIGSSKKVQEIKYKIRKMAEAWSRRS